MERETTELLTPAGHKAIVYTYITARELKQAIRDNFKNQTASASDAIKFEQSIKLLDTVIVSLDDSADNLKERLDDLPAGDFATLITYTTGLVKGNFPTEK